MDSSDNVDGFNEVVDACLAAVYSESEKYVVGANNASIGFDAAPDTLPFSSKGTRSVRSCRLRDKI